MNSRSSTILIAVYFFILMCPIHACAELFIEKKALDTGVHHTHSFVVNHEMGYLYHSGFAVGATLVGDVNGDDKLDIYLVDGVGENKLYLATESLKYSLYKGNKTFNHSLWGTGANLVDIDNDGDLDLYQCNYGEANELFLNDGKGSFTKVVGAAGLNVKDASMMANFADVDNDGDLDMYLLCNRYYRAEGRPKEPPYQMKNGMPVIKEEFQKYYALKNAGGNSFTADTYGRADYLFLNVSEKGVLKFKDVSKESGMSQTGYGLSSLWIDYDGDGDQDLYIANDFMDEDRLMRNDGLGNDGIPKFVNVAKQMFRSTAWSAMGSDTTDINRDGLPDLMTVDMSATSHFKSKVNMGALSPAQRHMLETGEPKQAMRNHLFLNNGEGPFQEIAYAAGVAKSDWSWSVKFGDLDNDGYQDIFITNGMARNFTDADRNEKIGSRVTASIGKTSWDLFKDQPPMLEENMVFQNTKGNDFKQQLNWGLGLVGMSYSSAMADLDNDGDLDLIVSNLGKNVVIYENKGSYNNHSFRVSLVGQISNSKGIGAKVSLTDSSGITHTRWQSPLSGFQAQNDMTLHFGLGKAKPVNLVIEWPSGIRQEVSVKEQEVHLKVVEKGAIVKQVEPKHKSRFQLAHDFKVITKEEIYDDFKKQPLLPAKLSQEGPCIAAADIDSDGDTDVFIGGSKEKKGKILVNNNGKLEVLKNDFFDMLAEHAEDSAALWFDVDGDQDLDLLVVTGSNEHDKTDILYFDHLYLNESVNGEIKLKRVESFPEFIDSGSCACAADFDNDGDLDLFIGSRSVPGEYPLAPVSRLLRNDTKDGVIKFTEIQQESILSCGMVTDAQWVDIDQDSFPELIVIEDWGITRVFKNDKGQLTDVSETASTSKNLGWWRALHPIDIDGDGDLDLITGNAGINTKYGTLSTKKRAAIYYGDMDGSGNKRIVEAKLKSKDRPLPVRGRS